MLVPTTQRQRAETDSPEQELSVQVADVNSVHVYYMNILEAREREVGQYLASQTPGTDDEDLALLPQELLHLITTCE